MPMGTVYCIGFCNGNSDCSGMVCYDGWCAHSGIGTLGDDCGIDLDCQFLMCLLFF